MIIIYIFSNMNKELKDIPKEKIMVYLSFRKNHKSFDEIYEKYKDELPYIRLNKLRHQMFLNIEDSIKYKTLKNNDFTLYNKIVTKLEPNHTEFTFKRLIKNFSLEKLAENKNKIVLLYSKSLDMYFPHNGNHRLVLYFYLNPEKTHLEKEYYRFLNSNI